MPKRSLVMWFALSGLVAAEVYMIFTVLAPHLHGETVPVSSTIRRLLTFSIFFGPFGAAVGTGVGLLVQGMLGWWRPSDRKRNG